MKKIIVIAEDIKALIEKEKSFFNRANFKIFGASTNSEILAIHKKEKADLIIAKLDSPEMNGETLCLAVREDNGLRNVSIIIISAGKESDIERCLQCKANAYISIPVNVKALLQETQKLLHIAPRIEFRVSIDVKLKGTNKEKPFTGFAENMSISGMLFTSDFILFEGDIIQCSFSLPGTKHISAIAEIVRVVEKDDDEDANRYGIKFTKLSTDALSALEKLVKKGSK